MILTISDLSSLSSVTNTFLPLTTSIKDLTTKLQTTSIMSAIPPILENSFVSNVNVHTDENLVMNAEEAKESPPTDVRKRFDDIGKREFNDKILFKKSKQRKKKSSMEASSTSLSSNSSEEKELSYTRPTIMNLSTVGILPDLRSPQSINYDIEYKEKILADVLNLDKVKIVPELEEDVGSIQRKIENDSVVDIESRANSSSVEQCKVITAPLASSTLPNGLHGFKDSPPGMSNVKSLYL